MHWSRRLLFLAVFVLTPLVLLALFLGLLGNRTAPVWACANVIVVLDKVLGAWTILPPAVSWTLMGFVAGAMVYFAIWECPRLGKPQLRLALLAIPAALFVLSPLVWPELELLMGSPMLLQGPGSELKPGEVRVFADMEFVWVPAGRFRMGSPVVEPGRNRDEIPHMVTLTSGFWLSRYEVTQAQWEQVMNENPSHFTENGANRPVENVTWDVCQEFIRRLNLLKEGQFRLPTEAEWEYACRAESLTAYCSGGDAAQLAEVAWYVDNSDGGTHVVGEKQPNAWGLYDMHGNVWEWCEDWYGDYPRSRVADPAGAPAGRHRVLRGGSWSVNAGECRSARRFIYIEGYFVPMSDIGLRVARSYVPRPVPAAPPAAAPAVPKAMRQLRQ